MPEVYDAFAYCMVCQQTEKIGAYLEGQGYLIPPSADGIFARFAIVHSHMPDCCFIIPNNPEFLTTEQVQKMLDYMKQRGGIIASEDKEAAVEPQEPAPQPEIDRGLVDMSRLGQLVRRKMIQPPE